MKKIVKTFNIVLVLVATLFATNSCSDLLNNPMKDKETGESLPLLLLDFNFFETKFNFTFVDAETGELLDGVNLTVGFEGDDAQNLVDFEGMKSETFTTNDGELTLAYDPNIEVSEEKPIAFGVYAIADDFSYFGSPVEVTYTTKGDFDIIVLLSEVEIIGPPAFSQELKSSVVEPTSTVIPFTAIENNPWGTQDLTAWVNRQILNPLKYYNNLTIYFDRSYIHSYSWSVNCKDLTLDEKTVKSWGVRVGRLENNKLSYNYNGFVKDESFLKDAFHNMIYGVESSDIEKCNSGLNINLSEKSNKSGTTKLKYELWSGDQIIKSGELVYSKLPQKLNTGAIYYPKGNKNIRVKLYGDNQYDISPTEIAVNDFCGKTVEVVATPKSDLKAYKIITSFSCPDQPYGITPSISGKYSIAGEARYTNFKFIEGVAILQLKPGETYEFNGKIGKIKGTVNFPTDQSKIPSVVEAALKELDELKDLKIKFTEQITPGKDNFVGTIIKIDVVFTAGNCPEL